MSTYGKLARSNNGVVVGGACDVFFLDEESAKKCWKKYGGEIQKLDDGWLVKKVVQVPSDDDPLIQAIWRSLREAGLIDSN